MEKLSQPNEMPRTTIMIDNLGRPIGRMRSSDVGRGWMEFRRVEGCELAHGHVRRAPRAVADQTRREEIATGELLPRIYA